MYKTVVARNVRRSLRLLSEGDAEKGVIDAMADTFEYGFIGDPDLPTAGFAHNKESLRRVFGRVSTLLPGLQLRPKSVVVSGWPWNTTVMSWIELRGRTASGDPYANDLVQIMKIRFGRITSLHHLEDTQRLADACDRMAKAGVAGADAPPIRD